MGSVMENMVLASVMMSLALSNRKFWLKSPHLTRGMWRLVFQVQHFLRCWIFFYVILQTLPSAICWPLSQARSQHLFQGLHPKKTMSRRSKRAYLYLFVFFSQFERENFSWTLPSIHCLCQCRRPELTHVSILKPIICKGNNANFIGID